ncbi:MAG: pseudaminic acid biosynthesis protein PseA [Gammaproteobacteria bacterium]|nr:pseudaminic acid biosynthesis protein PseA [Gammaproteobacteria bacterium]
MRYCRKCVYPDTRPEQVFDEEGVCDACRSAEKKCSDIDWQKRREELIKTLRQYKNEEGTWWDCIIPVSGGKNSCYQAYKMKYEYGMNPLLVNFIPCEMTDIGNRNLLFLRDLGFDIIQVGANRKIYREMSRKGFFDLGDCCWPEHIGLFTTPFKVAIQYNIPLIVYGENSQFEYGGPQSWREKNTLNRNWLEQFQMLGCRISDLIDEGVDKKDLLMFQYPSEEELKRVGVTAVFLGYYVFWDNKTQAEEMIKIGFEVNPDGPCEGGYFNFENLDCKWIGGLHDYMKFLKYGYGRATDQLCNEIRLGRLERDKALRLAKELEGKLPKKYHQDYLQFIRCTEKEYRDNLDKFTNKKIFKTYKNGNLVKDENGDVIKIDYGY